MDFMCLKHIQIEKFSKKLQPIFLKTWIVDGSIGIDEQRQYMTRV